MFDQLKEIILDGQEAAWFTGVPRRLPMTSVAGKASVCIGVRRCGKSTFMFQHMQRLVEAGVSRRNLLYLNFFDDRLHGLRQAGLALVPEAYYALFPEKKQTEKVYCFFDEMQAMPGWEPFIDRLLRTELCEITITGSSAQMLSREIATQMRGRALTWEMFPFSFREFLDFLGIDATEALSTRQRMLVQNAFDRYWQAGGFPEVAGLERRLRIRIHQEYFHAVLFRDLVERHDVSHPKAVSDLAHWLVDNVASLYSLNSLSGYLKSLGHKVSKAGVAEYLAWFEDAYFLFTVRLFDASLSRANANPKKIYCIDSALVTSVASGVLLNQGHLLENLVFVALRRVTAEVFYYKTKNGREVDFIVRLPDRSLRLVQVCETLADANTRKREVQALTEAMSELGIGQSFIVTRREDGEIAAGRDRILLVPAWRFLLDWADAEGEFRE